jgi:hypothetical protein
MAKEDFHKALAHDVELLYPRLNATYRYNTAAKQSEQCPPTASGAAYTVNWKMDREAALKLFTELKAHFNARKPFNPKLGDFTTVFGMKKQDDGSVIFKAKRNGTKGDGTVNTPPQVIGGDKQPLADPAIWSGSVGTVRFYAAPTTDPDGNAGISLFFDAVQVTEAVYGGNGMDDFDERPMAKPAAADPFGAPDIGAGKPAFTPPAPRYDDVDSDLPF